MRFLKRQIYWIIISVQLTILHFTYCDAAPIVYPSAARSAHFDVYHGRRVYDPYRWLEDLDSQQTKTWIAAENVMTRDFLSTIAGRDAISSRLKQMWNYERWSAPEKHGRRWFYTHNEGLQNQPVYFVTRDPTIAGRALLDTNTLSKDGTVAVRETSISQDGTLFAYAVSDAGSDWQVWHIRSVVTGKDLNDELRWSKAGGGTWRRDGSGFYYTRYDAPRVDAALKASNAYEKLFFHRLGTPQALDKLVYGRTDDTNWYVSGQVTDDGHYLIVTATHNDGVKNTVLIQDLLVPGSPVTSVISEPNALYAVVGNVAAKLLVLTDNGSPHYRVISIDLAHPAPSRWRTLVPERSETLDWVSVVGGQLVCSYLKDAHSLVRRYTVDGRYLGVVELAGLGTVEGFGGRIEDRDTYYRYSSFTNPPSIYRLDVTNGRSSLLHEPKLVGFDPDQYETIQTFYTSKDGTRVPMFIATRKGTQLDGTHPTILTAYGGFNVAQTPTFSPAIAAWLDLGGVFALANIRGGGEYGRAWHEAGMKTRKQNALDDFISAAEFLIAQKWTRPNRLAIRGASNGGLLVGAVLEQRPDLFAAAVPQVGVMDMLRFREFTLGKGWESDYGSVDNETEFRALLAYSPLQNVRAGVNYPSTLITTADHDDRVYPAHSFKFAAALQYADPAGNPILIRIEERAGHGSGEPTAKQIDETTDIYAFISHAMGLDGLVIQKK